MVGINKKEEDGERSGFSTMDKTMKTSPDSHLLQLSSEKTATQLVVLQTINAIINANTSTILNEVFYWEYGCISSYKL